MKRERRGRRCLLLAAAALSLFVAGNVRIAAIAHTAREVVHPVERIPSVRERAYMDALRTMGIPMDEGR
ncbi:MAG TPA: hypothetical protein VNN07_18545 [Candidatus Tectomicrobia bacterium]|nr:hypothetical protein [Candidatus Tectomicrobia bacterium]